MSQTCSIYGLGLQVNVPVAGLRGLGAAERIDVALNFGKIPPDLDQGVDCVEHYVADQFDESGRPLVRVSRFIDGSHYRIDYCDGTRVVVDARGNALWAQGPHGASVEDTAIYILGPALGFVLRLRGVTCLHASAVAIDGAAVAFVGCAGAGKSSLAAAFAQRDHAVITDDVAAIEDLGDRFQVQPAYPRIRLWPESAEGLFGSREALPRITPSWEKRYLDLNGAGFALQRSPLPLRAIYLIGDCIDGPAQIRSVDDKSAMLSLIAETYTTKWIAAPLRAREFDLLGRLVASVPTRVLNARDDVTRLSEACDAVIADLRAS